MLFTVLVWWLALTALGLAGGGLLLALGWQGEPTLAAWARPLGLLALAWLAWLLGHLLAMPLALGLALAVTALSGGWALWRRRAACVRALRRQWRALLVGEAVLLAALAGVALLRGRAPGIAHTEQPMDMAFLASCARAARMPPADPWLAGEPLNYYYLGYLIWGLLARLTGTAPTVAYHLALAATAGLGAQALYGLLLLLWPGEAPATPRWGRPLLAALGAGVIVAAGNLIMLAEGLRSLGALPHGVASWLGVPGLAEAPVTGSPLPGGNWWWRASRPWLDSALLGDGTIIVEFPAFSLILGDLHPHLMALPWSVAAVGLALTDGEAARRWPRAAALGWLLGGAAFVNGWELPTLLTLTALWQALAVRRGQAHWRQAAGLWLATLGAALLPYAPFWLRLSTQVTGLQVSWLARTPLRGYLLVFGAWLLPIGVLAIATPARWRGLASRGLWRWWLGWLGASLLAVWLVGGAAQVALSLIGLARGAPLALLLTLALAALTQRLWLDRAAAARPRLLLLLALALTYACELLFLRDLFGTRMNTLFKFYYQAWWLLGAVAVVALVRLGRGGRWQRWAAGGTALLWALLSAYPLLAMPPRGERWSLDALTDLAPADAAAVVWLRAQAAPGDVLLAAPGATYDPAAVRLSSLTGVPMVLGWPDHERQWGRSARLLAEREAAIDAAYLTADDEELRAVLRRYGVRWVLLGPCERERYGEQALSAARWAPWCQPALEREGLALLQCQP